MCEVLTLCSRVERSSLKEGLRPGLAAQQRRIISLSFPLFMCSRDWLRPFPTSQIMSSPGVVGNGRDMFTISYITVLEGEGERE